MAVLRKRHVATTAAIGALQLLELLTGIDAHDHSCNQAVNVAFATQKVRCWDKANPSIENIYNWDKDTDKSKTVNSILWTSISGNTDPYEPLDCPQPDTVEDPTGAYSIISGGWTVNIPELAPETLRRDTDKVTLPWYVAASRGFWENDGNLHLVTETFSGWLDFYGNVQLCKISVTGENADLIDCEC